jgi:hypothetical protein
MFLKSNRSVARIAFAATLLSGLAGMPAFAASSRTEALAASASPGGSPMAPHVTGARHPTPRPDLVQSTDGSPVPEATGSDASSCEARFRSYNPITHKYRGYDGRLHSC